MYKNIKFDIAFITTAFLGYLYTSGRYFFEGSISNSGMNSTHLGFDFADYTFQGFVVNLGLPQYLVFFFAIMFFIVKIAVKRNHLIINLIIIIRIIQKYLNSESINKNSIKIEVIKEYIKKSKKRKKQSLFDYLYYNFSISYSMLLLGLILILGSLLKLSNFYSQGEESSLSTLLNSHTYVEINNKKLYPIVCGKEKCIYTNKEYNYFYNAKEEKIEVKKLEEIISFSEKYNITSYIIDSKKYENIRSIKVQTNIYKRKEATPYFYSVKITTISKNNLLKTYEVKQNIEIDLLNSMRFKYEKNIPYFTYFEIPENETIQSLSFQLPPTIY